MNFITSKEKRENPENIQRSLSILEEIKGIDNIPKLRTMISKMGSETVKSLSKSQGYIEKAYEDALPQLGKDTPAAKTLLEANLVTSKVNPNSLTNSFLYKAVPFDATKRWLLRRYVSGVVSTQAQFKETFENLEEALGASVERTVRFEMQYESLTQAIATTEDDIAVMETTWESLEKVDEDSLSSSDLTKHKMIKSHLARTIRDMETALTSLEQFLFSTDQSHETESLAQSSMESLLRIGPSIVKYAVTLQHSIFRQREMIEATKNTQQLMGNMIADNAKMIEMNAEDAANLYNNPVIAIEKFEESYKSLGRAYEMFEEAQLKSTDIARDATNKLRDMREDFKPMMESAKARHETLLEDTTSSDTKLIG
jgi:hypothetical protein